MNIFVNNKTEITAAEIKLSDLLVNINLFEKKGIAVAVNNTVVQKNNWSNHQLKENDKITIIHATQGG
jgi:sulfur carrier protein